MRRYIPFVIVILLCPTMLLAQAMEWESIPEPYFVNYVNGVSVGWDQGTQYTYMLGSNLTDTIVYCTNELGAEYWPSGRQREVSGARNISACRYDGEYAASIVDYDDNQPEPGVHFTDDGGQSWTYDPNHQPGNPYLYCMAYNPTSGDGVVVIGNWTSLYNWTIWRQTERGQSWISCDPTDDLQPTNSLRYFNIDGQTELYACKRAPSSWSNTSGLWKSVDDGASWTEIGYQGLFQYQVWDFARTPSQNDPHYFVLFETNQGTRGLLHSIDLQNWSPVSGFNPPANGLDIVVTSMNDDPNIVDTLWLQSASQLTMLAIDRSGAATQLANFEHGGNTFNWTAIDFSPPTSPENPYPTVRLQMNPDKLYLKLRDTYLISKSF